MTNLDSILKSRDIDHKGPSSQGYGFSSSHVWMWQLNCKGNWALKNWCFWTVVLEKTLESPWDCKEIQPIHHKGRRSVLGIHWKDWCSSWNSSTLATGCEELTHWKRPWCAGKDWGQEEKGTIEDEMSGWHHRLNAHGFGWTPGVGDGQGGLACCGSWGRKESDTAEWLNWTEMSPKRYRPVFDLKYG